MAGGKERKQRKKGKPQAFNVNDWADPNVVAEDRWENEPKRSWTATTCKKYVKMTHLLKMWPEDVARNLVGHWEGHMKTCNSRHFMHRYEEVTGHCGIRDSKPTIMNYTNMAMVWAEIVLHKNVDWRTIYATKLEGVNRQDAVIGTSWTLPSDCMPEWSNRGQFGFPAKVMPDVEDAVTDDDEGRDDPAPVTFGATHERREARADIEYEHQMREAMRRSIEDRGPQHGYGGYYGHDRGSYGPQGGAYGSSSQEGSQYYSGSTGGGYYGQTGSSYYTGSNEPAPHHGAPVPPPTFGGPQYGNYGQGSSGSGDVYGRGPYMGIYGGGSSAPTQRDDTDSDSE